MTEALTQADIAKLMADRSASTQMEVVEKLTGQYNAKGDQGMNTEQSEIANDIFKVLLGRAEVQVRAMLANNLSHSTELPADIARKMAADVSEVANPILENSTVLSDSDLLGMINHEEDSQKLEAIARRKNVSETVSDALVETKIESVVKTVVENESADIAESTFHKITERHGESVEVMGSIVQRTAVPVAIVEKVIDSISDTMRQNLEQKYGDLNQIKEVKKALEQSLELASLKMLGFKSNDDDLMRLLNHLDGSNKLSPFSALSMGNLQLFEVSLSRLLRIPLKNVQTLLADANGFKMAYERAELPESLYDAAELAVRVIRQLEEDSLKKTGFKQICTPVQVMQHMQYHAMEMDEPVQGVEYLYAMMQQSARKNVSFNSGDSRPSASMG